MNNEQTFADITPDMIQDWKAKHGDNLSEISVLLTKEDEGDEVKKQYARFICKPPTRTVIDLVAQHGAAKEIVKVNKVLTSNCILGGDMELMERDGAVYAQVIRRLTELSQAKESSLKKI